MCRTYALMRRSRRKFDFLYPERCPKPAISGYAGGLFSGAARMTGLPVGKQHLEIRAKMSIIPRRKRNQLISRCSAQTIIAGKYRCDLNHYKTVYD